ncbi:MAG: HAD hydrolase-like protein [Oscillospiraceae bacterium]|jgi:phosphoglycolate phosphatase|nr:HAD hydrolase-like protein [Oscillospiraceae bacterium]
MPAKRNKFDAVLLDFDGTFADSSEGILAGFNAAMDAMGYPREAMPAFRRFLGPPLEDSFRHFLGMSAQEAERAMTLYREQYTNGNYLRLHVFDGMEQLLLRLREADIPAAIASAKMTVFLERILRETGYRKYFKAVVGTEPKRLERSKTDLLLAAAAACGVPPARCAMVGDRSFDMEAAKTTGMYAVGVLFGFGDEAELRQAGADELAADCAAIEAILF